MGSVLEACGVVKWFGETTAHNLPADYLGG
jgi:hypothetical protein